ncbi:MAG TPA: hypothetical protein VH500_17045 [Nitrososphaeraceae archaeon]
MRTFPQRRDSSIEQNVMYVLTDGQGIPLSFVVTAANTHDMKAAIITWIIL